VAILNERRRRVYPRLLLITVAFWGIVLFPAFWVVRARDGHQYGSDFTVYWSAASLAKRGDAPQVYEILPLHTQEQRVAEDIQPFPWHYPPQFLAMLLPLALLPYAVALAAWELATAGAFLFIFKRVTHAKHTVALMLAALPALILAFGFGQNGFLTAALLGGGLLLLEDRPLLGGGLLGIISYKPHLAPLAFVALLAGRRWRALAGAISSAAALALGSLAVLGWDTWVAFWKDLPVAAKVLDESGSWEQMPTFYAAIRLAGGSPTVARVAQVFVALAVVAAVGWLWHRGARTELRNAAVAVGTLVASPYAFIYDLPLAVLAMAWLFGATDARPWRLSERVIVGLVAVLPVTTWPLAALTGVQLGPIFLSGLLVIIVRRAVQSPLPIAAETSVATAQPSLHPSATA
jgi:hypothetical protein